MRSVAAALAVLTLSACGGPSPVYFFHNVAIGAANGVQSRPRQILFAADGNNTVSDILWRGWGSPTAVGDGIAGLNDCDPNCAEGAVTEHHVTVTLSHLSSLHGRRMYRCYRESGVGSYDQSGCF